MAFVNIVTADRGWILETLARHLSDNLDYCTYGDGPDPEAFINYYIPYSCFKPRVGAYDAVWITHLEPEGEAYERFFSASEAADLRFSQAKLYADMLEERGLETAVIRPGVELDVFQPKIKIGVVGRTYHTGRKGEHLVKAVMDIPGIEWHFTGTGWPGPALSLPGDKLPDFYNDMDYILVPALYEGGPMCVIEALACGRPVIAPPIGWVPDFPHIEYETGDEASLRAVLEGLVAERQTLRESVLDLGWEAWAAGHDAQFRAFAESKGVTLEGQQALAIDTDKSASVSLVLHGNEGTGGKASKGGPSVRVPKLASDLMKNDWQASVGNGNNLESFAGDVVHIFNVWQPKKLLEKTLTAKSLGKKVVISPIFMDLGDADLWGSAADQYELHGPEGFGDAWKKFVADYRTYRDGQSIAREAVPGYWDDIQRALSLADHIIFLSESERDALSGQGIVFGEHSVVWNALPNFTNLDHADERFKEALGGHDYVLMIGRVESRKNQLGLAIAARELGLKLVFLGHEGEEKYARAVRKAAGDALLYMGYLENGSDDFVSALAGARVFALPSWIEGAPLAALEAAAAGLPLVLSTRASEQSYFGDMADYCDPESIDDIKNALTRALARDTSREARLAQIEAVKDKHRWSTHVEQTVAVYNKVMEASAVLADAKPAHHAVGEHAADVGPRPTMLVDVTTSAHRKGRWTGIARVEMALALEAYHAGTHDVIFVAWNNERGCFIEVPFHRLASSETLRTHFRDPDVAVYVPPAHAAGATFLVSGSGWMQNRKYADNVVMFSKQMRLELKLIIHDIIPWKFPYWFDDGYAQVFLANLKIMLTSAESSGQIIAVSQHTKSDVQEFFFEAFGRSVDVAVFREGDVISQRSAEADNLDVEDADAEMRVASLIEEGNYVLSVGAIHARKNPNLLFNAWVKLHDLMGRKAPKLAVVGGVAWNGHEVARAMRQDRRVKDKIVLLENISDAQLDRLYEGCLMSVYPSLYEGWGLPVAEALRKGKVCLATNVSSVPEIAPDLCELMDPTDVNDWAETIAFWAQSTKAREAREAEIRDLYRPTDWKSSYLDLMRVLTPSRQRSGDRARFDISRGKMMDLAQMDNLFSFAAASDGLGSKSVSFVIRTQRQVEATQYLVLDLDCVRELVNTSVLHFAIGRTATLELTKRQGFGLGAARLFVLPLTSDFWSDENGYSVGKITFSSDLLPIGPLRGVIDHFQRTKPIKGPKIGLRAIGLYDLSSFRNLVGQQLMPRDPRMLLAGQTVDLAAGVRQAEWYGLEGKPVTTEDNLGQVDGRKLEGLRDVDNRISVRVSLAEQPDRATEVTARVYLVPSLLGRQNQVSVKVGDKTLHQETIKQGVISDINFVLDGADRWASNKQNSFTLEVKEALLGNATGAPRLVLLSFSSAETQQTNFMVKAWRGCYIPGQLVEFVSLEKREAARLAASETASPSLASEEATDALMAQVPAQADQPTVENYSSFKFSGFHNAEEHLTWTNGRTARVILPLINPVRGKTLVVRVTGCAAPRPENGSLALAIVINGVASEPVSLSASEWFDHTFRVAAQGDLTTVADIEIIVDRAICPHTDIETGSDRRTLGIGLQSLKLDAIDDETSYSDDADAFYTVIRRNKRSSHMPRSIAAKLLDLKPVAVGAKVSTFEATDSLSFMGGWHAGEPHGRWSSAERSEFRLCLPEGIKDATLHLDMHPFLGDDKMRLVTVIANNQRLDQFKIASEKLDRYSVALPDELAEDGSLVQITLMLDGVSVPAASGVSADERALGICLTSIALDGTL